MRLGIIHLSDLHLRSENNPISQRLEDIISAIRSIVPVPKYCLVLVTGDISFSGREEEFLSAQHFFDTLRRQLCMLFGPDRILFDFVPGNHDCLLPEDEVEVREAIVERAMKQLNTLNWNSGLTKNLLAAQKHFWNFYERFTGTRVEGREILCRTKRIRFETTHIQINAFNTALLSQRKEQVGSLSLPMKTLESGVEISQDVDLFVTIYHHPEGWFDPTFRSAFGKFTESVSHFVFTGHEHQRDAHWTESLSGEHVTFVEGDALQDETYPRSSGFGGIVIDLTTHKQSYWSFRYGSARYTADPNGAEHPLYLLSKGSIHFSVAPSFLELLAEDDFGFTHPRKKKVLLADIFVYPSLTLQFSKEVNTRVSGPQVFEYILKTKFVHLVGQDYCGKTSLLKTVCKALLDTTNIVPIFLRGDEISARGDSAFIELVKRAIRRQYSPILVEPFFQLAQERRAILVDDLQNARLGSDFLTEFFELARQYFGLILVTSSTIRTAPDFSSIGETDDAPPMATLHINELRPSARGEIINRWLRLGLDDVLHDAELMHEQEREQQVLNELIRRKALPALPYLIVGALQIRHGKIAEAADPGSFGYLFEKLVIDALSVTAKSREKHIERKDRILRRFAFHLFKSSTTNESISGFEKLVECYKHEVMISVNASEIIDDLVAGRVLTRADGNLAFRQVNFFYYFLARHLLDELDGNEAASARAALDRMAERPLDWANRLTLMFVLFFRKTDPIIDNLIKQADLTFESVPVSDITSDVKFIDDGLNVPPGLKIDEGVDVREEQRKRYRHQDEMEEHMLSADLGRNGLLYSDDLDIPNKMKFAIARMELLGQVVRNFSGSLDGSRKVEILTCVFKLGLRLLHIALAQLKSLYDTVRGSESQDEERQERIQKAVNDFIPLAARIYCDAILLTISRAVGVRDIEQAYEEAVQRVGDSCATLLVNLAIKLDHSRGFPLKTVEIGFRRLSKESLLATSVLKDIVARHVSIYPLHKDTLRKIAGTIEVSPLSLVQGRSGDQS
jgi:hypothetical protein